MDINYDNLERLWTQSCEKFGNLYGEEYIEEYKEEIYINNQ